MPSKDSVQVTITPTDSKSTPPGWNSGRRYVARGVLWFVVVTLMTGKQIWATFFSAVAIIILKEGTLFSGKNIKWMLLSAISFLASLGSWSLEQSYDVVDEEKAYGLKISLWLGAKSIQGIWSTILGAFLFSAAMSNATATTEIAAEEKKK